MLQAKRSFSSMMDTSPTRCSPFSLPSSPPTALPPKKRSRTHTVDPVATVPLNESKFASPPPFKGVLLEQYIQKTIHKNRSKKKKDLVFSLADLNEVVSKALQEREEALRCEYDEVLAKRQQEHFQTFAKFNDDYITKKKDSPEPSFMYMY